MATAIERTNIIKLVTAMFNAAPGSVYLSELVSFFDASGGTSVQKLSAIATALGNTTAYKNINPNFQIASEFASVFLTPYGLQANQEAIDFITAKFNAGVPKGQIAFEATMALNDSTAAGFADARAILNNKTTVAEYFSVTKMVAQTNVSSLQSVLSSVTAAASSVTAANTAIDNGTGGTGAGTSTFTLTTGTDLASSFTGGAGNDTFNATNLTFNASDAIVGGAGTDTLFFVDSGTTGGALAAASVSGIEIINIRNVNGSAAIAQVDGVTAVNERQEITLSGTSTTTSTAVSFLGIATATLASGSTATQVGAAIETAKANILAGTAAVAAGLTDITSTGAVLTLTFGGTNGKGDVANIASSSTSNGISFTAGTQTTQGVTGVVAVTAVAAAGITDIVTAANFVGATAFNSDNSTSAVTFTGVTAAQSVGMIGNGSGATGNLNFTTSSAAVASATINVSGGTRGGTISSTNGNLTSATLNSTGAANVLTALDLSSGATVAALTIDAATNLTGTSGNGGLVLLNADYTAAASLTVKGAATSVALGAGATANFKTIDASGLTAGGVSIAGGSNLTSFKGGVGNDTFITAASYGESTAGMINAGTGTDVLVLSASTDMDSAAKAGLYTGFETLRTNGNQNMTLLAGITAVQIAATTGVLTGMTATQAAAVQVRVAATSATFTLADAAGTSDVLNLSLGTGTTTAAATGFSGTLVIDGFETLNITTNAGPTAAAGADQTSTIAAITAANLTAITLKGQSVTLTSAATAKATTIDASALTGNGTTGLTLGGDLFAGTVVTGSAVADAITLGTAGSTYNLGAGADTISGTAAQLRNGSTYNTVDAGAGIDTLTISGGATLTLVDDDFKGLTNLEKITVATTSGNAQSITTGGFFDTNFKAAGLDLTTTATTGAIAITASSFSGAAKINATNTNTGAITVATGSGADNVTITGGTGNNTISTGAGIDTIVGSGVVDTITAGAGADVINAGAGSDVFIFNAGDSNSTNTDAITGYATTEVIDHATLTISANSSVVAVGTGIAGLAGSGAAATFSTADTSLAQRIIAVEAAVASVTHTAGEAAHFQVGGDTYVFITDGVAGVGVNDTLIQLIGVDSTNAAFNELLIAGGNLNLG